LKSALRLLAAGMVLATGTFSAATAQNGASEKSALELQAKIDRIQLADEQGEGSGRQLEVSETELESYVLFQLKDQIPARLELFDVQLTPGAVAADTRMTFSANATGNPMVDALVAGTHTLFVKGKLRAQDGTGRFELIEVHLDGIPVPNVLIETLVARYVKPKYPEVDLNEPFPMPWGIEALNITAGRASVQY
jgi:hypothetical protein